MTAARSNGASRPFLLHPDRVVDAALTRIRGRAAVSRPNVRRLAQFAALHQCPTAAVAFAAGVDTNRIFAGTQLEMPFGQSSFAIARGIAFEKHLRRDNSRELRRVLTEGLAVDFADARIANLRQGYPPNSAGMALRAAATRDMLVEIASGVSAPLILDGAVLAGDVGGVPSFFEADEIAIGVDGEILVGEEKSWPIVDGRATDENALGAALDQQATYVLLGRTTLDGAGADPGALSANAALINPRNTGLTPVLHRHNVEGRVRRIERLLDGVPRVADIAASVPSRVTFERVGDTTRTEVERLDAFLAVTNTLGTTYEPGTCLSSCGFAAACRRQAFSSGSPTLAGACTVRALPGIADLGRAAELSRGATPTNREAEAATLVARAGSLYDEAVALPMPSLPLGAA